jgi:hypothetical protein
MGPLIVLNLPVSFSNPSSEEEKKCGLNKLMKGVRKSYILDCLDDLWLNPTNADKNNFSIERKVDI